MQITLIGLDTLALSLGLALKAVAPEIEIVGHDRDRERLKVASQTKAVDKTHWNLLSACDGSELVVLNESLSQVETELSALAEGLSQEVVVLVLSQVQRPIQTMLAALSPEASFIGGRFVARDLLPDAQPTPERLKDALFYVIAPPTAPADALHRVVSFGEAVGANACFLDAAEHDGLAGPTAQLPRLLGLALLATIGHSHIQRDMERAMDPSLAPFVEGWTSEAPLDDLLANGDNLSRWLSAFGDRLTGFARCLNEADRAQLQAEAEKAVVAAQSWGQTHDPETDRPQAGLNWRQLLLGHRRGRPDA